MKIAFIADVHIGNHRNLGGDYIGRLNRRFIETNRILSVACENAKRDGCVAMVVCGDLFDTDDPSPPQVAAVRDSLCRGPKDVYLLLGNHEQHSTIAEDNALSSLNGYYDRQTKVTIRVIELSSVVSVTAEYDSVDIAMIPFRPGNAISWFSQELSNLKYRPDALLVFHLGVSDTQTATDEPWMMGCHDQLSVDYLMSIMRSNNISAAFAGNWHKSMFWEADDKLVYQIGALVPTGWNNPGGDDCYGSLVYWDNTCKEATRKVIPGPRYMKYSSVEEFAPYSGSELIRARIEVPIDFLDSEKKKLDLIMPMGYAEVVVDPKSTKQIMRESAVRSKTMAYSEDDLVKYIQENVKVNGADVIAEVTKYLKLAK